MGAFEDFVTEIKRTETMQALLKSLEEEPAKLLSAICKEYEATNRAVPDHHLSLMGYFGEAILRSLLSAKLITKETGDRFSLCSFRPTEAGLKYHNAMLDEKRT
jgi:hypothetical protein